jgi:hypothetical protein
MLLSNGGQYKPEMWTINECDGTQSVYGTSYCGITDNSILHYCALWPNAWTAFTLQLSKGSAYAALNANIFFSLYTSLAMLVPLPLCAYTVPALEV